jgi:hypothetical protein
MSELREKKRSLMISKVCGLCYSPKTDYGCDFDSKGCPDLQEILALIQPETLEKIPECSTCHGTGTLPTNGMFASHIACPDCEPSQPTPPKSSCCGAKVRVNIASLRNMCTACGNPCSIQPQEGKK